MITKLSPEVLQSFDTNRGYFMQPNGHTGVICTKGRQGIPFKIDFDFLEEFENKGNVFLIYWDDVDWPHVKIKWKDNLGVSFQKKGTRFIMDLHLHNTGEKPLGNRDILLQKDGDFMNLLIENIVVIRDGSNDARRIKKWLKTIPDRHPAPGVYFHEWSGKWAAYLPRLKVFIGLYDTAEEAEQVARLRQFWWDCPVNF